MSQDCPSIRINLNKAQFEANLSEKKETFLIGGVGLGKSFFLGNKLYNALLQPECVCGLYAPTRKVLKNSTWIQIKEAFDKIGIYENEHYVYNKFPPLYWGVKRFTNEPHGILTTRLGSYCIVDGLDNPDSQRGVEFDEIFVDEFRDVKKEARDILIGRARGRLYKKIGKLHRIWYATTPPDDVTYLRDLYKSNNPNIAFYFGSSVLNRVNLPKGYIEHMESNYDSIKFRREVGGELIGYGSNLFFCAFHYEKHVAPVQPDFQKPVYITFDFNVNPMCATVWQRGTEMIRCIKEYVLKFSDLPQGREPVGYLCELMLEFVKQFPAVYITGDTAGRARSVHSKKGDNSYTIIYNALMIPLRMPDSYIKVLKTNPEHSYSRQLCNSLFERYPSFLIDENCKGLIRDLESVQIASNGSIDKSNPDLTHLSDGMRYFLNLYYSDFINIIR